MKGTLKWMATNHVAANLLMMLLVVGGLIMSFQIKQEVFPEISLDIISITVPYPGAGPEEIEEGIVLKVEEALSSLSGIKKIRSSAAEGAGRVIVELMEGQDTNIALQDVKSEVDRITTFPEEAEEPVIIKVDNKQEALSLMLYGDAPERSLVETADNIRDELLSIPGITQVDVYGARPYEISIEVPEANLRRYGLTLESVASAIRQASLDLPAGSVKTESGEVLIRTKERKYIGREYAEIAIIRKPDGTEVKLSEIATVRDEFEETDVSAHLNGKPSAMIRVYRVGEQKPTEISAAVVKYVEQKKASLPDSMNLVVGFDSTELFKSRRDLLIKNAMFGLALVFVVLGAFMRIRLSLWVMLGIPISFLGAMLMMPAMDVSINMISLFAFILVLGIVVDDAIVVGENIYDHRNKGKDYTSAAIDGVVEVGGPVIFSILTTVAAFLPLMYIEGTMGKFIGVIPAIVIPVLTVSLIESLFILPSHLTIGQPDPEAELKNSAFKRARARFNAFMDRFINGPYARALAFCLRHRYSTLAAAIVILMLSVGLVAGGIIKFTFMPEVEGDQIIMNLRMPVDTTVDETTAILDGIVAKGIEAAREIEADEARSKGKPVLEHVFSISGSSIVSGHTLDAPTSGGNLGGVMMFLTKSEMRAAQTSDVVKLWREKVGEVPGADSLTFASNLISFGANVNVQLAHKDFDVLERAADRLKASLAEYPGVSDIDDSSSTGKPEAVIRLKPEARTLGLTEESLGRQIRSAFYGAEALRVQRGRDEVKVMVRLPESERKSLLDLSRMTVRTPSGADVPLSIAASTEMGRGYSIISRTDRKRVTNVTADVDEKRANADEILADIKQGALPAMQQDFPGLVFNMEGEEAERKDSMGSMGRGFAFALIMIYALLAIPFRSYSQPLLVMTAIPFGIVGAVLGHLIMGYTISILSVFGIVALAGVVVNDSLLLIDYINRKRTRGVELMEAVQMGGVRRFRPILLTSLTTFFGLAPMIMETSVQARFLIPMAISLAFGIMFATGITLVLIPSLYMILEDVKRLVGFKHSVIGGLGDEGDES